MSLFNDQKSLPHSRLDASTTLTLEERRRLDPEGWPFTCANSASGVLFSLPERTPPPMGGGYLGAERCPCVITCSRQAPACAAEGRGDGAPFGRGPGGRSGARGDAPTGHRAVPPPPPPPPAGGREKLPRSRRSLE